MPVESQIIDDVCECRISGALSIWEAAAVWDRISPLLADGRPLRVDLSAVDACDAAGIQILCLLRTGDPSVRTVTLTGVPTVVTAALEQMGMEIHLFVDMQKEA